MFPAQGLSPERIKYLPTRLKEGIVKAVNVERIDSLDTFTVPVKYPVKQIPKTSVHESSARNKHSKPMHVTFCKVRGIHVEDDPEN